MEMQYYRTFIDLPVNVSEEVLEARQEMKKSLAGERISWVDPDRYHITLRFLGDTRISVVGDIKQALEKNIEIPKKTHVMLTRPGSFGSRKNPRVIWIGFEHSTMFESLKNDVDRAMASCGIAYADQPFRSHLTLGRVRSIKDLNGFYYALDYMKNRFCYQVFFERLIFYRSELGKGSPVYTPLHKIEFRD